ncbi:hypothetical protein M758_10G047400 [Ceratodon purpureus]|uniref:Secreted protein n=1 Tax=Ceratodon purpureus TaxID=3225 RepID=A0A8T0GIB7_CERPU|nr:hypothetical protein KC19_10G050300 [Ceratodon purpureus]KAG0602863.1 hypothetical protein M758_10G047400 [Ceratodon purpureus]
MLLVFSASQLLFSHPSTLSVSNASDCRLCNYLSCEAVFHVQVVVLHKAYRCVPGHILTGRFPHLVCIEC